MQNLNDTIVAISTPPGEGAIAIIRLTGAEACAIASTLFSKDVSSFASHSVHFGRIVERGEMLDEALCLVMRSPRSYTGEDVVELQCHGGMVASQRVLQALLRAGARAALPGEFTFRAFMKGKIDLVQAEAISSLIGAKNEKAFQIASQNLEGALSKKVLFFQERLTYMAAILEAWVDFPEEGLEFTEPIAMIEEIQGIEEQMNELINSFEKGKKISHGILTAIVGAPNAGKSSLLNALLEEERAIVTPHPGTTRDLLYENLQISGLTFRLIDTAGIRETAEEIEKEGIARTKKAIEKADLILFVLDAREEPPSWMELLPKEKTLCICNKIDLPHTPISLPFPQIIRISAKTGEGIKALCSSLSAFVGRGGICKEEIILTSLRHQEALQESSNYLQRLREGISQEISPELLTQEIRGAIHALSRIIGVDVTEEILSSIFANFCIGK